MTPFDELTLQEVEELTAECLDGKSFADSDPFSVAAAVMYKTRQRNDPGIDWATFKRTTRMFDIKEFSEQMAEDENANPLNGVRS